MKKSCIFLTPYLHVLSSTIRILEDCTMNLVPSNPHAQSTDWKPSPIDISTDNFSVPRDWIIGPP